MIIHDIYSYGQLFCFSGLDGETSRNDDFVGMLMDEPITIRFHFDSTVTLNLPLEKNAKFNAVTGDMLDGENFFVAFVDRHTIVGKSPVKPLVLTEKQSEKKEEENCLIVATDFGKNFYLITEKKDGSYYFAFSYDKKAQGVWSDEKMNALKKARLDYFKDKPTSPDEKYAKLFTKCLSINKENVYSPEGVIKCRWTTPDRVPHRFMWIWDSVFHAMAFSEYNIEMAKDSIRAVLGMVREDGFLAHMMSPDGFISEVTQPQVLAWGVWYVYQKCGDKSFLEECAEPIAKFLLWTKDNRDKNGNGLLEWLTEPDYLECKCGESGLDNSPRFDFDIEMDAIDFSTWLCNDAHYLSLIYNELGISQKAEYFRSLHENVKAKINEVMWCEEDGLYYDVLFDGKFTHVATPSSFFPMLAGICSQEQADKMVKVLLDENRFWTKMPVPSMPKDSEFYDIDMWRGCSWLNLNYFILVGLRRYGYEEIAEELRKRTLDTVYEWYQKTGNVFEFYDADNKICPLYLKRKGEQPPKPDYREHVHSITDYNWSACFTQLLILNKF
ncbi:MAG: hypothetical protein IKA99_08455 [Clostridia bacterium]|nr:hypothetical protein [Clostridia bacterium]